MKPSPVWQVTLGISPEAEEAVTDLMQRVLGAPASIHTDVETARVSASVYLPRKQALSKAVLDELRTGLEWIRHCGLAVDPAGIRIIRLRATDWAESWKRHFKPFQIGSSLLVKPSWSKRKPAKRQAVVVLDPGLSFGTGQHPTTRFCLEQIVAERNPKARQSLLDLGTGSGILGIAAVKLGYQPVEALDFDADAVRIACLNAQRNRVDEKWTVVCQDVTRLLLRPPRRYDVVCANLMADLLIAEREKIIRRVVPGGLLVLAGILDSQFSSLCEAYEPLGMRLTAVRAENEWKSAAFRPLQ